MNSGYLKDIRCPKCKSEAPFAINAFVTAQVSDDKVDDVLDIEWDNDNHCRCLQCGYDNDVYYFYTFNQED